MFENIRLEFQGIWSRKMRSFLTMLGIIIGIAAIIAIVSTIKGTNDAIKNNLVGSGNNTVDIKISHGGYDYTIDSYSGAPWGIPVVSQETKDEILALDEVENVTTYSSRYGSEGVYYKNTGVDSISILGIDTSYFDTCNYVLKSGRGFSEEDYKLFRKVLIADQVAGTNLFADENPLGKTVEISGVPFTVIGLVEERSKFQPEISSIDDYYTYY